MPQYFIIHKPFNVLSQFTSQEGKRTLKDFFDVPVNVYPVGRLDYDSEGLLILTDDKQLNHQLLDPLFSHEREYLAEVEGEITTDAIHELEDGPTITVDGKWYKTKPCTAKKITRPATIGERVPPVRFRKNIPTSWIKLVITEGKNRQVRKMTAKTGFPTLRLIRYRICRLTLDGLMPGEMSITSKEALYPLLFDSIR